MVSDEGSKLCCKIWDLRDCPFSSWHVHKNKPWTKALNGSFGICLKKILMISNWCLGNTSCYDTTPLIHPRSSWYWNHCNSDFFKDPIWVEMVTTCIWSIFQNELASVNLSISNPCVYVDGAQTALSQVKVVLFWVVPLWPLVCLWMQTGDIWSLYRFCKGPTHIEIGSTHQWVAPQWNNTAREGQEERSRALRRRLKAALPEEGQQAIKAQQVQLREEGRGSYGW